ncbi:MAG: tRNA (N6-threonylcarbamoyladenosine(37)-N6)-methyltransferase TrmO [Clostridia bacterium]|nr:tRNA (N6-threonylcarbamoyladenosine(37)-N6)-methyltransferase TrmO [Clostridia bacterium]
MDIVAYIHNDFRSKFGIPRQSGLLPDMVSTIVFEPRFRDPEALRGIEGYSHLWLLWDFSEAHQDGFQPTVRPPRLGGNRRMGVFATRSPFRPNAIGLSSVRLVAVEQTEEWGTVLRVAGADLKDHTPILDIKPYIAYTDSHPDAVGGFSDAVRDYALQVEFPAELLTRIHSEKQATVLDILKQDPRPSYQQDPERIYGMDFGDWNIRFTVNGDTLTVVEVTPLS